MATRRSSYPPPPMNPLPSDDDEEALRTTPRWQPTPLRRFSSWAVVYGFICVMLYLGVGNYAASEGIDGVAFLETPTSLNEFLTPDVSTTGRKQPDFGQYIFLRTITAEQIDIEVPQKRVIIIGDVHGMDDALVDLLRAADYEPTDDTLIHVGDIVTKGPQSMQVLSRMAAQNVTGVRGNHDQKVIEWRGYMDWVRAQKGGKEWLDGMFEMDLSPKQFETLAKSKKKWDIPEDWKWGGPHFYIARHMSHSEYEYLRNLPLAIHIPSLHTFIVHAGLLPADPTRSPYDKRQPLSHLPKTAKFGDYIFRKRILQEISLLTDVPQNRNPFTALNVRNVTPKGKVSRKTIKGQPWSDIWNGMQNLCEGFDAKDKRGDTVIDFGDLKKKLPCYATTMIYGHAASRGLDIKRWSFGIDTGCVYGRRLTAFIIGDPRSKGIGDPGGEDELEEVRYSDSFKARLVSVKCKQASDNTND